MKRVVVGVTAAMVASGLLVGLAEGLPATNGGRLGLMGAGAAAGGGGSSGGEETTANNLSVPTVFVPNPGSFTVTCGDGVPSDLVHATGDPTTGYPLDTTAYYYVQGTNTWQAQCETAAAGTVSATAAWGDNLTGSAKISASKPIRVEVALSDTAATTMGGFTVQKLEPGALDRNSAYGTLATKSGDGYVDNPLTPFTSTAVYDAGATLTIYNKSTPGFPIVDGPASAEINATGNIVYGYNLTVPADGYYVLEFDSPNVTLTGADAGTVIDGHLASLTITVGTPPPETTLPPTTTVPVTTTTAPPPTTSSAVSGGDTSAPGTSGSVGTASGLGVSNQAKAAALKAKGISLGQLNKAIVTTNASIHKFHQASVFAKKKHLAIQPRLAANVKRLEIRLHSLLVRRRAVVASIAQLNG